MYLPRRRPPLPGLPQGLNVHKVDGQPLSSIPALSLGLLVVYLFTWEKACQRQRWTMVCGQVSRTALANPPPPSGTGVDQTSQNSAALRLKARPPQ